MTSLQEAGPARPLRVVLDTNVVLDALLFGNAEVAPLWQAIRQRRLAWFASPPMRSEFAHQLGRAALSRYLPDSEHMLTQFDEHATVVADVPALAMPQQARLRCRDADDQIFVDLAWHLQVDGLLTRDRDLLALARKARPLGLQILAPAAWASAHPLPASPR